MPLQGNHPKTIFPRKSLNTINMSFRGGRGGGRGGRGGHNGGRRDIEEGPPDRVVGWLFCKFNNL